MKKARAIKRFKIVEQIIVVILLAVLAPMIVSAIIINNVNQHAVRNELQYSALTISESIASNIKTFLASGSDEIDEIVLALKYIKTDYAKDVYLKDLLLHTNIFDSIDVKEMKDDISFGKTDEIVYLDEHGSSIKMLKKINDKIYLDANIDLNQFKNKVFNIFKDDERQIYILNKDKKLIAAHNFDEKDFNRVTYALPKDLKADDSVIFGKVKNQPLAYFKMISPEIIVIVNTTHQITKTTINTARYKILAALFLSALFIISVVGLYTYYLYINIRQLFKAVMALSMGNYNRKIRLLTSVFTPYEIIFLADEFNKMITEINMSYRELKHKNKELKKLDEFRANLVDAVSHEFRTPLTSIKGYTSRLLRQDITLDEETKQKSLKIIKNQTERLSRMVEDLLVIPDIEGARLKLKKDPVNLIESLNDSLISVKNHESRELVIDIPHDFPLVLADNDRLEQVLINLIDNAIKYSEDDTPISISAVTEGQKAVIKVTNEAPYIPPEVLNKLFGKFIRVDDTTTRTTRGTGLGLFIVKGLVLAMGGSIELVSLQSNEFSVVLKLNLA